MGSSGAAGRRQQPLRLSPTPGAGSFPAADQRQRCGPPGRLGADAGMQTPGAGGSDQQR